LLGERDLARAGQHFARVEAARASLRVVAERHILNLSRAMVLLLAPAMAAADPVRVRYAEGPSHGFIELSDDTGDVIAHGEVTQWLERGAVVNRMVVHFDDGSLYDEQLRFSQQRVFRLQSYRLVQRGPSFSETSAVEFDRTGRYTARTRSAPDEEEESASGHLEVPDDVYNGMTSLLLKNLMPDTSATTRLLAFSPKPTLVELRISAEGTDQYWVGSTAGTANRFLMQPKVTGMKGVLATVVGKQPPDFRMWIAQGKAPMLVRFEGPLYADGPVWTVELGGPRWKR
jgi:hypothetical protein